MNYPLQMVVKYFRAVGLILFTTIANAQVFDYVIAKDGSGDFNTFGAAMNRLPMNKTERTLIYIKNGIYEEKVNFYKSYKNFSLIGEDQGKVMISWDDYSGDSDNHTTSSSYTFFVEGEGFYAENIIFKNTAGNVGQAVAVSTTGNQQVFNNCSFFGFQDTYYVRQGMQFNLNCYIEGATDFIFGGATAVFQNCEVKCLSGGQYITAPADTKLVTTVEGENFYHGTLFLDSKILAGTGVSDKSYYLGRPWQPNASSVYINCVYDDHIRDEGWSVWSGDNHLTGLFAEYNNTDISGALVDVSGRVDWSVQLTPEKVDHYYNLDYFLDGWDPMPLTEALETPQNLSRNTENEEVFELKWDKITDAKGYVITKNNSTVGFSETFSFVDESAMYGDLYKVRSVSFSGALSEYSNEVEGERVVNILSVKPWEGIMIKNGILVSREPVTVQVYSLSGEVALDGKKVQNMNLTGLKSGIYILRIKDQKGQQRIIKIAL